MPEEVVDRLKPRLTVNSHFGGVRTLHQWINSLLIAVWHCIWRGGQGSLSLYRYTYGKQLDNNRH